MDLSTIVETKSFSEYRDEWDILNPRPEFTECECNRFIICLLHDSLGRPRYKQRCAMCYRNMGHVYKRVEALEILAGEQPFDNDECQIKRQEIYDENYRKFRLSYDARSAKRNRLFWDYHKSYMKSMRWHLLRAKALTRDEYKCAVCQSTDTLQLHHRHYENMGCENLEDVITLCKKCHEMLHITLKVWRSENNQSRNQ